MKQRVITMKEVQALKCDNRVRARKKLTDHYFWYEIEE